MIQQELSGTHCEEDDDGGDPEESEMRMAMRESRRSFFEDNIRKRGGSSSSHVPRSTSIRIEDPIEPIREKQNRGLKKRSTSVRISGDQYSQGRIDHMLLKTQKSKQPKIKTALKGIKGSATRIGNAIGKWFYYSHIPFHTADNPYFRGMMNAIQEEGPGVALPTAKDLGGSILLDVVDETRSWVETHQRFWDEMGCTLMCDAWSSQDRRSIINFLVYCPMGTVFFKSIDATANIKSAKYICDLMKNMIHSIGEGRIIQVITDNRANFKAVGKLLMERKQKLYWTPYAAHCIDLMLEDIGK